MAETILAILSIVAGIGCAVWAVIGFFANAIGGVTNAAAVNLTPVLIFAVLAVALIAGGIAFWP